jgi:hypothetical protein
MKKGISSFVIGPQGTGRPSRCTAESCPPLVGCPNSCMHPYRPNAPAASADAGISTRRALRYERATVPPRPRGNQSPASEDCRDRGSRCRSAYMGARSGFRFFVADRNRGSGRRPCPADALRRCVAPLHGHRRMAGRHAPVRDPGGVDGGRSAMDMDPVPRAKAPSRRPVGCAPGVSHRVDDIRHFVRSIR